MTRFIANVVEDENGEQLLEFPAGCLPEDWVEGTTIEWIDNKDGTWTLKKKETDAHRMKHDQRLESRKD